MRKLPFLIIGAGLGLYLSLCFLLHLLQSQFIFFPIREHLPTPEFENLSEIEIDTKDNVTLNAWFLDNKSDQTVIFCHGNGGNISFNQERLKIFNDLGINAIIFDYRGYGSSGGKIETEDDVYRDANAVYQHLIDQGVSSENITIWGQSLGAAIAIDLAQNKPVQALIVESGFFSMNEMARRQYPWMPTSWLLRFKFRSDEKISNVEAPVLVIHSREDELIEFSQGLELFELANEPKFFLETQGSHNGGFATSYQAYLVTLQNFLKD